MNYGTEKEYEVIAYIHRTERKKERKNSKSIREKSKSFNDSKSSNPECVTSMDKTTQKYPRHGRH